MDYVVIWLVCGLVAAMIGSRKGAGGTGFCLGILLGPIGILIAVFMKGNRRQCVHCKELIHPEATICAHCQREQPDDIQAIDAKAADAQAASDALSEKTRLF